MKRLFRDRWDKKLYGVCGGIGVYCNIDPTVIRILFVAAAFLTFALPVIALYFILVAVLPEGPHVYIEPSSNRLYRSLINRRIAGCCGGVAEYLGIDATIIRIVFAVCSILSLGYFIIFYILCIFIIPEGK